MNSVYEVDFVRSLPDVLQKDPKILALGRVIGGELQAIIRQSRETVIFARIMTDLSENVLDILARDFNVVWYDDSYPIEVKRQIILNCVKVHRSKGTKFAVETAIGAVHPHSIVQEWFEYGGEPFHFKIIIDISQGRVPPEFTDFVNINRIVALYKRLSAHLEYVELRKTIKTTDYHAGIITHNTKMHLTGPPFDHKNITDNTFLHDTTILTDGVSSPTSTITDNTVLQDQTPLKDN